jgi:hypothetical protein
MKLISVLFLYIPGLQLLLALPALTTFIAMYWHKDVESLQRHAASKLNPAKEFNHNAHLLHDFVSRFFKLNAQTTLTVRMRGLKCLAMLHPIPIEADGPEFAFATITKNCKQADSSAFVNWFIEGLSIAMDKALPTSMLCTKLTTRSCLHLQACRKSVPNILQEPFCVVDLFDNTAICDPRTSHLTGMQCVDLSQRKLLVDAADQTAVEDLQRGHPELQSTTFIPGNDCIMVRCKRAGLDGKLSNEGYRIPLTLRDKKYRLTYIVCYKGTELAGHYYGFRFCNDTVWYINDSVDGKSVVEDYSKRAANKDKTVEDLLEFDDAITQHCVLWLYLPTTSLPPSNIIKNPSIAREGRCYASEFLFEYNKATSKLLDHLMRLNDPIIKKSTTPLKTFSDAIRLLEDDLCGCHSQDCYNCKCFLRNCNYCLYLRLITPVTVFRSSFDAECRQSQDSPV